ncbi:hypothetical protein N9055_03340, partial [Akkermansiaceae bacterium]|nr:hypothetical protein [Akkermansiaceae bacterium]
HDNAVHNLVGVQEQDWYTTMRTGWTQALGEASVARIQEIIDEYFPDGRPVVDLTPPSPNPMTWVMPPVAYDSNTIIMEAAVASDASAAVEYYFENTNNGDNSGWISGTSWSNTGLTVGQSYSYRVRARDSQGNTGNWSAVATAISAEDHTAPNPDPMTWETPPAELSSSAIMMTASTAVDPTGVQYYFTCTSGPGHDSGWQDSPVYMDAGLDAFATCSYTVMARDKSANANQTAASPSAAATITRAVPGVLFADTFNRANSTNLNASDSGKSGALGLLNYSTKTFDATTLDITNNRLRINGPANDGAYGGLVYIDDHNFVDASIALSGGFSVSVDIAAYITAGSGRQMSVGVGQSLADLNAQSGVGPGNHSSDLLVAYRNTTDDLEIYKNGVLDAEETVLSGLPNAPTTMRIDYTLTDFEEGSTVIYHVYFDDASSAFTSGTFTWSGTDENYISLASNLSEDSLFDNLEIRGEDTYEDLIPPTPNPMIWELVPTAVSPEAITMTATTATDFSGVEYYFKNTTVTDGSHDSGWQSASTYTDTGLAPETIYTYTVTARDNAPLGFNETESSDEESASTTALLIATMAPVGSGSGYDVSSAEARAFRSTGMAKTLDVGITARNGDHTVENAVVDGMIDFQANVVYTFTVIDDGDGALSLVVTDKEAPENTISVSAELTNDISDNNHVVVHNREGNRTSNLHQIEIESFLGSASNEILEISYDSAGDQFTLTWESRAGISYYIYSSPDLIDFSNEVADDLAGEAGSTTFTFDNPEPGLNKLFFLVGPPPAN